MARPTIDHLLDHTVRHWRRNDQRGDFRERVPNLVEVAIIPAACRRPRAPLGDPGAGLTPIGERIWYTRPDAGLRPTDILEVLTGPTPAGECWEVDEPVPNLRTHHLEARCRFWSGQLPSTS